MMAFEQSQTQLVAGRVTLEQRRAVEMAARRCGVSKSAIVRVALTRLLELRPEALERCVRGGEHDARAM